MPVVDMKEEERRLGGLMDDVGRELNMVNGGTGKELCG